MSKCIDMAQKYYILIILIIVVPSFFKVFQTYTYQFTLMKDGINSFPVKNQVYTHLKCCEDVNLEPTCVTCKMNGFSE